jgi:hypothetical protein
VDAGTEKDLSGRIIDENGKPLSGLTVLSLEQLQVLIQIQKVIFVCGLPPKKAS